MHHIFKEEPISKNKWKSELKLNPNSNFTNDNNNSNSTDDDNDSNSNNSNFINNDNNSNSANNNSNSASNIKQYIILLDLTMEQELT
ncbi:hypothetical protein G9A89_017749 [Geosiphon pyriformis]|nr:hypothetical protein G9A89_017749 [Geosiphon pyriformis]